MQADTRTKDDIIGPAITDVAGEAAGQTQIDRLVERYHWVAKYIFGGIVLEVACGTGQGLGLLSSKASQVVGFDLSMENLRIVRTTFGNSIPLIRGDAHFLPFATQSIDVILLLETIYFLPDAGTFLAEAARVLKPGGRCLISSINKDCPDFNPNHPLYHAHYGATNLSSLLREHGFSTECFGIIPMDKPSFRAKLFHPVKRFAIKYNLIPDSMQARRLLKRVVFGNLDQMPRDIRERPAPALEPQRISTDSADRIHQVVLCAGLRT